MSVKIILYGATDSINLESESYLWIMLKLIHINFSADGFLPREMLPAASLSYPSMTARAY